MLSLICYLNHFVFEGLGNTFGKIIALDLVLGKVRVVEKPSHSVVVMIIKPLLIPQWAPSTCKHNRFGVCWICYKIWNSYCFEEVSAVEFGEIVSVFHLLMFLHSRLCPGSHRLEPWHTLSSKPLSTAIAPPMGAYSPLCDQPSETQLEQQAQLHRSSARCSQGAASAHWDR